MIFLSTPKKNNKPIDNINYIGGTCKKKLRFLKQKTLDLPFYTVLEEVLNAATHGIGVVFGIISFALLLSAAPKDFFSLLCVCTYGVTMFLLYSISTLYHALGICKAKKVLRILDHCSIFLMIAGTYTPVCFFKLGKLGLIILIFIWSIAILGIVLNSVNLKKYSKFSSFCYIAMGWAIIFGIKPLIESITSKQFWLLVGGGICYTIGFIFYALGKKVRYVHSLWHLFVLAGSILQFLMIYSFFC